MLSGACLVACAAGMSCRHDGSKAVAAERDTIRKATIPDYAQRVIDAYPDFQMSYADNRLTLKSGAEIVCDDGREKDFVGKLDDCDVEDMFSTPYSTAAATPGYLSDCGRGRCEALFKAMYGSTAEAVRRNLVAVDWFGDKVLFTKVNGANRQLEKVAAELSRMPQLRKYLKSSGTFYWRKVRGANRQSAHSYGIAIDIGVDYSNYWLWSNPGAKETDKIEYENRMPREIVQTFEKHGFIWGGRWYHYDTMHFEYRPELH